MTIRELQEHLKDRLNGVEALVRGGCRAFAEDTRTVYDESAQFMSGGVVAVVVVTPDFARSGDVLVRCVELKPFASAALSQRSFGSRSDLAWTVVPVLRFAQAKGRGAFLRNEFGL